MAAPTLSVERGAPGAARLQPDRLLPVLCLVAASALWVASLPRVDLDRISDVGLITALPATFFLAVAVLTAGFFLELAQDQPRSSVLWAYLGAAVLFLQGVVSVVEGTPRFPTSWIHAGFTNQIADHHTTLPMLDARFSWPGFFSAAALVQSLAGLGTALWFVRWAPVVFGLVTLLPAAVIVHTAAVDRRAQWMALWLFCVANWVGQDYFAPQALNLFLYLAVLAVLLRVFQPGAGRPYTPQQRTAFVGVVVVLFAASTISHQLTPFALAAATAALVVGRRLELGWLPVLFVVGALAWLSFGAEVYWRGHLADVTGGLGRVSGSLQSGVGQRLGGNPGHTFITRLRMVATVGLLGGAAVGAWRTYRLRGRAGVPWAHALLALSPFSLVALQSYGGEILLRVYLFALLFVALLVALAFFPGDAGTTASRPAPVRPLLAAAATSLALALCFLAIRYGNERFESFRPGEVAAVEWVYDHAPAGSRVVALNPSLPWKQRDITTYSYISQIPPQHLDEAKEILDYLTARPRADGYLIITRSEAADGELNHGMAPGWTDEVERLALSTGSVEVAYRNDDAVVLHHGKGKP